MEKTTRIVCLTGHRDIPAEHALLLPALLDQTFERLVTDGAREFRAGGAVGFDMLATLKLLEVRERHPDVRIRLFLPCRDQTRGWDAASVRAYRYVLDRADEISYTADQYYKGCMLERDRRLVTGSDLCLAYCIRNRGGTYYTCTYALANNVKLENLAEQLPRGKG